MNIFQNFEDREERVFYEQLSFSSYNINDNAENFEFDVSLSSPQDKLRENVTLDNEQDHQMGRPEEREVQILDIHAKYDLILQSEELSACTTHEGYPSKPLTECSQSNDEQEIPLIRSYCQQSDFKKGKKEKSGKHNGPLALIRAIAKCLKENINELGLDDKEEKILESYLKRTTGKYEIVKAPKYRVKFLLFPSENEILSPELDLETSNRIREAAYSFIRANLDSNGKVYQRIDNSNYGKKTTETVLVNIMSVQEKKKVKNQTTEIAWAKFAETMSYYREELLNPSSFTGLRTDYSPKMSWIREVSANFQVKEEMPEYYGMSPCKKLHVEKKNKY
jgi:hypothetical protein